MNKYKLEIDKNRKIIEKIPTSEIKQDLLDTQREVDDIKIKIKGYLLIGDKISRFKANGLQNRVFRRAEFIGKLKAILNMRKIEKKYE